MADHFIGKKRNSVFQGIRDRKGIPITPFRFYCNPASTGWNFEPPAVNPFPNRIRPDKKPRPGGQPRGAVRWAVQDSNLQPWD